MKALTIPFATLSLAVVACHSSSNSPQLMTKDSFDYYQKRTEINLADMLRQLDDVYQNQSDLAKHAFDDSIEYWHDKWEVAEAGGKNFYVLSDLRRKELEFRKMAADSVYHLASIHAKREQDKVWESNEKAQKAKEVYEAQRRFEKGEITEIQYNSLAKQIHDRQDPNPVTEQNALKMTIDYNKHLYEASLKKQQELLEKGIDSLSK
jgi:hypothetical protein